MMRSTRVPPAFPTRLQLLVFFSVLVAAFVAVLAVGAGRLLEGGIRDEAVAGAEQTAQLFAETEIGPEEYRGRALAATTAKDLDVVVGRSASLRVARLWSPEGRLQYASDRGTASRPPRSPFLRPAVAGAIQSRVTTGGRADRLLEIYLPIRLRGDPRPRSVLELALPYAPIQATIDERAKALSILLAVAALLFYLALLPNVLRGSGALASLYAARQGPLQRRLRRAMADGELILHYQPKLDLRTGAVPGVEALLRWRCADGGLVPPVDYIPLIEPTPVMKELTAHVFELAARQSAEWAQRDLVLDIAVNISACNLQEADLPDRLARLAAAHGRAPEHFTLEITESAISGRPEHDLQTLRSLRQRGFKLAIDDFGTGHSSLSRIDAIEFQELKIDRSFIQQLAEGREPLMIARIVDLGHALGARVVAEGVELDRAMRPLADLECDIVQGYHVSRPLPPEQLERWLRDRQPAPAQPLALTRS